MEPLLKSGIILAAFHSMGTEPDCKDKFIMHANGLVIIVAASFNIPGGKLSTPVDLFLLRFLSSLKTSSSETELKANKTVQVMWFHMNLQAYPRQNCKAENSWSSKRQL